MPQIGMSLLKLDSRQALFHIGPPSKSTKIRPHSSRTCRRSPAHDPNRSCWRGRDHVLGRVRDCQRGSDGPYAFLAGACGGPGGVPWRALMPDYVRGGCSHVKISRLHQSPVRL